MNAQQKIDQEKLLADAGKLKKAISAYLKKYVGNFADMEDGPEREWAEDACYLLEPLKAFLTNS